MLGSWEKALGLVAGQGRVHPSRSTNTYGRHRGVQTLGRTALAGLTALGCAGKPQPEPAAAAAAASSPSQASAEPTKSEPAFQGKIDIDVRKSTPDWTPYTPRKAPEGAPNVLFVLYDDTGLAAWSPYGGAIEMPTLDKLAANGLTYTQWHTTALCSPTRSALLTGRNHHLNGFASISEASNGFPGQHGRLPEATATIGQLLQDAGWSTFWVGKNHNLPEQDVAEGASRKQWPLQKGFDRFYGFLGGETNNWYPDLVEDNHFVEPPYGPEQGYHLSKDLTDKAIQMIRDQKATNPSKPWYMWFNPGANHAPHHAPKEYADKYKGKFDQGYDAYRKWVLDRMIAKGVVPADTKLTPINPMPEALADPADFVRPWESLSADEKKLFSRMAEVFAGFSEYTDAQIGRLIGYLEETKQLDNTIVLYAADNGTSGEGSPGGSVNENKFFNGYPDDVKENLKYLDKLGGPDTYNHFPTGWATAFSTPFRMFKRYAQFAGGTNDPLVISWPKGIKARGELRHQYHHAVDIVPTLLELTGVPMPDVYRGVKQYPMSGTSMVYTFDAEPNAPSQKHRQYYAMFGTRGLWEDGWKAATIHPPFGKGNFESDEWELYHVAVDRSESTNLAAQYPEKLAELKKAWFDEAEKNLVLPLDDRTPARNPEPGASQRRSPPRALPVLSWDGSGARRRRRQRARSVLQDSGQRRPHEPSLGRHLRPGFTLWRACALHQGSQAPLRLQLPRHRSGAGARVQTPRARQADARRRVRPRQRRPPRRIDWQSEALRERPAGGRRAMANAGR